MLDRDRLDRRVDDPQYQSIFQGLFKEVIDRLVGGLLPTETDIRAAYETAGESDCVFIQRLSLFFTGFFSAHIELLEMEQNRMMLEYGMHYLVRISQVEDPEIFKICLEYWNKFTQALYKRVSRISPAYSTPLLALGDGANGMPPSVKMYQRTLSLVRSVMIQFMAKPEEVLIVEDENGEIVRETMKDSDAIMMYKTMRETLVYLTHLNYDDTENIMLEKLQYQVDGSQWSWHNLNTLCWAIGSISGAMSEEDEKRFLVTVIKDLLGLCEMKRGKDNKAVVASNIMYVVGQYPRFLRAHWKFLKTVVNKLFEFMHELHPGVQDMACDTFLKIAQKCRRKFVILQVSPPPCRRRVAPPSPPPPPPPPPLTTPTSPHPLPPSPQVGEAMPFIDELCLNVRQIISDLEPSQVQTFYEAVGYMVSAQADSAVRDGLLNKLMEWPNQNWHTILEAAKQSNGARAAR